MFLLSLLLSTAGAAEIQVAMSFPAVIAVVDGVRQVNPNVTMFTGLTAGPHEVEVRNLIGNTLAKVDVTVDTHERLRLQYSDGALVEQGRGLLPSAPPTLPAVQEGPLTEEPDPSEEELQSEEHAPAPAGESDQ